MLSTSGVGIRPASQFGLGISDPGSAETGEFDFMTYLLGLQGNGLLDETSASQAPQQDTVLPKGDKQIEEPVLSLFQGAFGSMNWNPLLVGTEKQQGFVLTEKALSPVDNALSNELKVQKQEGSNQDASLLVSGTKQTSFKDDEIAVKENFSEATKPDSVGESADSKFTLATQQKEIASKKYGLGAKLASGPSLSGNPMEVAKGNSGINEKKNVEIQKNTSSLRESVSANENQKLGIEKSRRLQGDFTSGIDLGASLVASGALNKATVHDGEAVKTKPQIHEATVPQMFDRIESMASQGGGKMTVRLSPPSLGQVEIQVTTRGKNVEIEMRSENGAAKSVIESGISDLKTSMHSNDLVLSKMEVHVHREISSSFDTSVATQSGGGSAFQSSLPQGQFQAESGRFFSRHEQETPRAFRMAAPLAFKPQSAAAGRVDLRI